MQIKHFLSACLLGLGMTAQAAATHMIVELKSGSKFSFLLKENPVITFSDEEFIVNENESTSYAIDEVKLYYFSEGNETATTLEKAQNLLMVSVGENTVEISNAAAKAHIQLTKANGQILSTTIADEAGAATLQLPKEKGIVILSAGKQSFKIIRK